MSSFAVGFEQKHFVKSEATFDTIQDLSATDACALLECKIEPDKTWNENMEQVGSGSQQPMIAGMESGKWSAISYIKPAAAGTAPDTDPFLEAALGGKAVSASTSVTYSCSDSIKKSLQIVNHAGTEYQLASGAIVEQLDIEVAANEPPKMTFQGPFARFGSARGGQVGTGGALSSATDVPVKAAHIDNYRVGGVVNIGTGNDNRRITAVNYSTNVITVTPALAAGVAENDSIVPYTPSMTLGGSILGGIDCSLSIDSVAYGFIEAKYSIKTGRKIRDREASSTRPTGMINAAKRMIDLELTFYLLDRETAPFANKGFRDTTSNVILRIGPNTAGSRLKVNTPKVRWFVAPVEVPNNEEVVYTLKGRALQNSAAADELTLVFD